jgi:hypothetical protein
VVIAVFLDKWNAFMVSEVASLHAYTNVPPYNHLEHHLFCLGTKHSSLVSLWNSLFCDFAADAALPERVEQSDDTCIQRWIKLQWCACLFCFVRFAGFCPKDMLL